ncbi:helix-turn-helix domain-containing protein [Bacillus sp. FSL W7-1334]|uniref:helix-turn-helix domain-containing protein n=1 Tax=Bacillus sp. FSL W7-1334 TaxID=2921703 RepID=UPI0030F87508|nr:helix-turn-helix domain-containing protein [Bacillus cereus]
MQLTVNDVMQKLNLSRAQVIKLYEQGKFPTCEKIKGRWWISEQDLIDYQNSLIPPKGYICINEAAEILRLSQTRIKQFIHTEILQGKKYCNKWLLLKEEVVKLKEQRKISVNKNNEYVNYITVKEAAKLLEVSDATIYGLIRRGKIKGVVKSDTWKLSEHEVRTHIGNGIKKNRKYEIPENYIDIATAIKKYSITKYRVHQMIKEGHIPSTRKHAGKFIFLESELNIEKDIKNYLTTKEAGAKLNLSGSQVTWLINKGRIENVQKNKGIFMIPKESIERYQSKIVKPADMLTTREVAKRLGISVDKVGELITRGDLIPEKKLHSNWLISKKELERYESFVFELEKCLTLEEVANQLSMSIYQVRRLVVRNQKFSGAIKYNEKWYIPQQSVEEYKKILDIETAEQTFIYEYNRFIIPNKLKRTLDFFNEYTLTRLSASRQREEKRKVIARQHIKIAHILLLLLHKELFCFNDDEINKLLNNELLIKGDIDLIVKFIQYCEGVVECHFDKYYVVTKKKSNTQEVYSPREFYDFYLFVKNVDLHLKKAIENRRYSVIWVYTLMHFIDAWRSSDILTKLPYTPIEIIGCTSFESIENLSREKSQLLINCIFTKIEKMTVSKTGALGQFLVHGDMVIPTATALAIAEIHRREKQDELLLRLYETSTNTKVDREMHIIPFFGEREDLYHFQSRKMNRSLLTYFYYSVVEGSKNSDIAYELSQRLRAHEDLDSTATYIAATNKDGSVDRVSLNLVNRGHFGWLYNFIVEKFFNSTDKHSLEERTKYIQAFRQEYTPMQLETLACFLNERLKEQESLALRIAKLSKDELKKLLARVFKGEMPAKMKHAQCLIYPNCVYQTATSCLQCEYVIPKAYLLISIDEEIKRLIKSIKDSKYTATVIRDYRFLIKVLDLVSQATGELGKDYVKTFINLSEIKRSLLSITYKINQIGEI